MSVELKSKPAAGATPIHTTDRATFKAIVAALPAATRRWFATVGFDGAPDSQVLLPDDKGALKEVWAGVHAAAHPFALSALPRTLPAGGAKFKQTVGDALLAAGFPAIHAVGRAAAREPRLIELNWGKPPASEAHAGGQGRVLRQRRPGHQGRRRHAPDEEGHGRRRQRAGPGADLVMALKLPVRLQLLIPAVENAISGNAYRPGDVFKTRKPACTSRSATPTPRAG
jgi:hypothetical protein